MTEQEKALEKIKIMQAFVDGKKIEFLIKGQWEWNNASSPSWDWDHCEYRVKPEVVYRPWNWEEIILGTRIISNSGDIEAGIQRKEMHRNSDGTLKIKIYIGTHEPHSPLQIFKDYKRSDGSPCGAKISG